MASAMHKAVIHKAGGYDRLKLEAHPVPKPDDRQVLIRTEAVGVNYADVCVRWGVYESARRFVGWPITPGFEYPGWVEEVGREVTHVKPGDPVFGVTLFNGYATHVCAQADLVWLKPNALNFETAAGFLAVSRAHSPCWFCIAKSAASRSSASIARRWSLSGCSSPPAISCS